MRNFLNSLLFVLIGSLAVFPKYMMVTTSEWGSDTIPGSLSYLLKNAEKGDSIGMNIPGSDSIRIDVIGHLSITNDIAICGKNRATEKPIIINQNCFTDCGRLLTIKGVEVHISNAIFWGSGNNVNNGGVIAVNGASTKLTLDSVEISGGFSQNVGGGLFNDSGTVILNKCLVWLNFAGRMGGGICNGGSMTIVNSVIARNRASSTSNFGGIALGGGIYNEGGLVVIGSTITSNVSEAWNSSFSVDVMEYAYGGGLYALKGITSLINTTLYKDTSKATCTYNYCSAVDGGGALGAGEYGLIFLTNCTLNDNRRSSVYTDYFSNIYFLNTLVSSYNKTDFTNNPKYYKGKNNMASFVLPDDSAVFGAELPISKIYGKDTAKLADNGGLTPTVALKNTGLAVAAGTRSGYFYFDTLLNHSGSNNSVSIPIPVYLKDHVWLDIRTNSPVPPDVPVTEISTDQRGEIRGDPPCIGAFELTAQDEGVRRNTRVVHEKSSFAFISLVNKKLVVKTKASGVVELFTCTGQRLLLKSLIIADGTEIIPLPKKAHGVVVCKITCHESIITKSFIW